MGMEAYRFADLSVHPEIVQDIERLEQKIKQQLGETLTLIAYEQKEQASSSAGAARAD